MDKMLEAKQIFEKLPQWIDQHPGMYSLGIGPKKRALKLFELRYCMEYTYRECGAAVGLSVERVRRILTTLQGVVIANTSI